MSAVDITARGLAARALEATQASSSPASASLVGMAEGGTVQEALATSRAQMETSEAVPGQRAHLVEGDASGQFEAIDTVSNEAITSDQGGRFIPSAGAPWVRKYSPGTPVSPLWWPNASPDGVADNAVPLSKAALAASENGERMSLATSYRAAEWGTTEPLRIDSGCTIQGNGARTSVKALAGFPTTVDVNSPSGTSGSPGPEIIATVPAPLLLFNHTDAWFPGLNLNRSGTLRLDGNGLAPVGLMILGSSNMEMSSIRIDGTTYAGSVLSGVQNGKFSKLQFYQAGQYGMILLNGTYNCAFHNLDLRQQTVADLLCTDDAAYPYKDYFGVKGARECVFIKGVWEDSLGGASGPGKDHVVRFEEGQYNIIMGSQWHGKCNGAMLYEGPNVGNNLYAPSSMQGGQHNGKVAELRGYLSRLRDTSISLFGAAESPTIADLIEVYNFAAVENIYFASNNYFAGKLIANKSNSPNDAGRINYVPRIRSGSKGSRNLLTFADKVDAITTYFETDTRRLATYDYRSTVSNKWGDQPTYSDGATAPSVDCPDDVVMEVSNSVSVTFTNLANMRGGQKVTLIFKDANSKINHGGTFLLTSAANYTSAAGEVKTFTKDISSPYKIRELGGPDKLKGAATCDVQSIAAGAMATTTVVVAGAAVGDIAVAAFNKASAGLRIRTEVTSSDVVTVTFENPTSAPVDRAAGTVSVRVWKA